MRLLPIIWTPPTVLWPQLMAQSRVATRINSEERPPPLLVMLPFYPGERGLTSDGCCPAGRDKGLPSLTVKTRKARNGRHAVPVPAKAGEVVQISRPLGPPGSLRASLLRPQFQAEALAQPVDRINADVRPRAV